MRKTKFLFAVTLLLVLYACSSTNKSEKSQKLPILGMKDVVNGDTIFHTIPPFKFLNQDSTWIDQTLVKNQVYLAYFFFTSCPSICPKMTTQMRRLQKNTQDIQEQFHILSFTIDPGTDSPSKFRDYIKHFDLDMSNWDMLTGEETTINKLGIKGFLVHNGKDDYAEGGYAHSTAFVLVDKNGYIRGLYDGTNPEKVDLLEKDLRQLLKPNGTTRRK